VSKLLILDDQETDLIVLRGILSNEYEIYTYNSLDAFKVGVEENLPIDLIISDLNLDEGDGRDVIELGNRLNIPVIIITVENNKLIEAELLALGAVDFIQKPVHEEIVLLRVSQHIQLIEQHEKIETTQDQLILSEKLAALGQLAAGVAHEINNPVGFVTSNTNLVKKYVSNIQKELKELELACEEEETGAAYLAFSGWNAQSKVNSYMDELLEIVNESVDGLDRIRAIVKDLKEYSHIGSQKFETTDINGVLKSTVNLLRNELKYKAEVELVLGDIPMVQCISSQINQVFVNIIVNACHAISGFGKVTVRTDQLVDNVKISISDTGVGMPAEVVARIFDPFFTTKPIGKGTGIGLAITKSIIDRHHGHIFVKSEKGNGASFTIMLPIEQHGEEMEGIELN